MENIQINGQKIWGPPRDWRGPPPPHGTEIYIKNLPDNVSESELFQIFSVTGKIYEVRLPVHWSGSNRGYAFVRYTKVSEADAAIRAFDGFEIRKRRAVKIERSVDNTRLFLSCVPNYKTSDEIKRDLQGVVENVEKVYVYPTLENPTLYRGYAFVEFKSHRDAAIAKRILTPDVCFNVFERKCVAAWANPLPFLNENVLKTINILFMRNVPKDFKSITVKKAIENLLGDNSIQKVKRLNDFAFLTFKNHETANAALNILKRHPSLLGSKAVQIEWAVPRDFTDSRNEIRENNGHKRRNHRLPTCLSKNIESNEYFHINDHFRFENDSSRFNEKNSDRFEDAMMAEEEAAFQRDRTSLHKEERDKVDSPTVKNTFNRNPLALAHQGVISLNTLKELLPLSASIDPVEKFDSSWSGNGYVECEETLRSPPPKQAFLDKFRFSSTTSSPALTSSPTSPPVFWGFQESLNSPSETHAVQSDLENLTLNNPQNNFLSSTRK